MSKNIPPELAVNAAKIQQAQNPAQPGAETLPKAKLKMVASARANKPVKTASVSDDLDRGFVDWMKAKADEDVVKTAGFTQAMRKSLDAGKIGSRELEDSVRGLVGKEKLKSLLKGTVLGGAATAGAGALYVKGRRDQRAKTAGVVENQDNLDLLALIKKRMSAGSALVGDV